MADYKAPVEESDVLLRRVIDAHLTTTGGDVDLDDVREILGHAGALASEVIEPLNAVGGHSGNSLTDVRGTTAPGFTKAYKAYVDVDRVEIGLPREAGGCGLPGVMTAAVNEVGSAANVAFPLGPGPSVGAAYTLFASAGQNLRQQYLPPLVSSRWVGTMNLTAPQSGTDLAGIRTIGRPRPDGTWGLKGKTIFITWGDHDLTENIVHLVLARSEGAPAALDTPKAPATARSLVDAGSNGAHHLNRIPSLTEAIRAGEKYEYRPDD